MGGGVGREPLIQKTALSVSTKVTLMDKFSYVLGAAHIICHHWRGGCQSTTLLGGGTEGSDVKLNSN